MNSRQSSGFALIKFTAALIMVAGLGLGMAPMYYKFINDYRATAFTNGLVQSLQLARSKAVSRGSAVSVCASDNGQTCTEAPWSHGYIVFADAGAPGVVDADDGVIETTRVRGHRVNVTLTGGQYLRFLPNGGLLAQAPATEITAKSTGGNWLDRLSPISAAVADDEQPESLAVGMGDASVTAVRTGAFTVCVGPSGRAINISYLGRITTSRIPCE